MAFVFRKSSFYKVVKKKIKEDIIFSFSSSKQ